MSVVPYLKNIEPCEFEARFSTERKIKYEEIRRSDITFDEIRPFLDLIPPRERDLVELYYEHGKNQKDIARMFSVTQGAISSRLARAKTRLKFLRDKPKIPEYEIEEALSPYFEDIEIEIIKTMIKTTCQSRTAELINSMFELKDKNRMTQVKIRHRFEKCINQLEYLMKDKPELEQYHDFLVLIKDNLYKLHEVKLPHFDRGAFVVFSINQ